MSEVIITKLLPPQFSTNIIGRSHLIEGLSQKPNLKLIVLTAPAGYGKTVFALQYVQTLDLPLIWYHLDCNDNDLIRFIQHLFAGLQAHWPDFGKEVSPLLIPENLNSRIKIIFDKIIYEFVAKTKEKGLVLVLDDYHTIEEEMIHTLVQRLLDYLPSGIKVVITSRTSPHLILGKLNTAGELFKLGKKELRFTIQETRNFLVQYHRALPDESLEMLEKYIAGWPAALRLLCDSSDGFIASVPNLKAEQLNDYIIEVFTGQPEDIQEFLMATSVLVDMTPESCNRLLKRQDSETILQKLADQELFLMPLTHEKKVYRYHQLFQEFFLGRLGSRQKALIRRAAQIAWEKKNYDSAVEYLMTLDIDDLDGELFTKLKRACQQAFRLGRWQTVGRWLKKLPGETIVADNWLSFFQAKLEIYHGKLEDAEKLTRKAMEGFTRIEDGEGLAECQLLQARILSSRGCYKESLDLLEKAERYLKDEIRLRFELPMEKSLCLILTGNFEKAEGLLTEALNQARFEKNDFAAAHLLEGLANGYYLTGNFDKALVSFEEAAALIPDRNLPNYYTQDNVASIYILMGEIDRAFKLAQQNVENKKKYEMNGVLPSAYYWMGRVYMEQGQLEMAEQYFLRAIQLCQENKSEYFFDSLSRSYLSQCLGMQGRWDEAKEMAERTLLEISPQANFSLAVCQNRVAWIYISTGEYAKAEELLLKSVKTLEGIGYDPFLSYGYSLLASLYLIIGNQEAGGKFAQKSLHLAADKGYIQDFISSFDLLKRVLKYGLENNVKIMFVENVLAHAGKKGLKLSIDRKGPVHGLVGTSLMRDNNKLLWFQCLGPLRIYWKEEEITDIDWRPKEKELLVYLAYQGTPVHRDTIINDLLGGDPDKKEYLQTTASRLRKIMKSYSPGLMPSRVYYLDKNCYQTDFGIFEERLKTIAQGIPLNEKQVSFLEETLALYGGDFLASSDFLWSEPYREKLSELYKKISIRVAEFYYQRDNFTQVIEKLSPINKSKPEDEYIVRLLMTAYAGSGNHSAVAKIYSNLTTVLREDYDLEPDDQTLRLYHKLCGPGGIHEE